MPSPPRDEQLETSKKVLFANLYDSEVRKAVESGDSNEEVVTKMLSKPADMGEESWRGEYGEPTRMKRFLKKATPGLLAMGATFGAIGYGFMHLVSGDSHKQQLAMRARVSFQGLSIILFAAAFYPAVMERKVIYKDYFPTVDNQGQVKPESMVINKEP